VLDRLVRKFATAKRMLPKPVIEQDAHIDIGIVAFGSSDGAVREALDMLAAHGVKTNYMRLRAFPFGEEVEKFLEQQKLVFVIEQNRDAQMRSLLTLETRVEKAKLRSLLHYSGLPISSEFIVKGVLAEIEPKTRKPEAIPANKIGVA
jgi:2-oxoglutarate/2-oxoacid ferredoxin oxidoreductase subunit alpha